MVRDHRRLAVFAAGFCAFLVFYAPQAVLPQLAEELGISPAAAGSMVGVTTLAVALAAPLVGMLADRVGRKRTIVGAATLLTLPTLLLILATDYHQILFWRFAQGLFLPAIFSATVAYVSEEWPPAEAADVTGVYIAASALGGFTGRFVTALLAERFGWKAGFEVLTVLTLASACAVWMWLPEGRRAFVRPVAEAPAAGPSGPRAIVAHLANPLLAAVFAVGFAVLFSMAATFTYINFHLAAAPFALGPAQLGMIFLVYPVGAAVTPFSGAFIRRLGRRVATVLALGLSGAGLLLTLAPQMAVIVVGLILFVTGVFLAQSSATGFVAQAARYAKSTAVGLYVCCYYLGGSAGSVLPGLIWRRAGWAGCVALVLVTLAVAAALSWRAMRPRAVVCAVP